MIRKQAIPDRVNIILEQIPKEPAKIQKIEFDLTIYIYLIFVFDFN